MEPEELGTAFEDLPLATRVHAAEVVGATSRLVALDNVWTAYLDRAAGGHLSDGDDVAELQTLVGRLLELLSGAEASARRLIATLSERSDDLNRAFEEALQVHPLDRECLESLEELARDYGGFALLAQENCRAVIEQRGVEVEELVRKVQPILEDGSVPEGDISRETKRRLCYLAAGVSFLAFGGADGAQVALGFLMFGKSYEE